MSVIMRRLPMHGRLGTETLTATKPQVWRCQKCSHWARLRDSSTWGKCAALEDEEHVTFDTGYREEGPSFETMESFGCVLFQRPAVVKRLK